MIDDNEDNTALFNEIFLRHMPNYELIVCTSGEECLHHIGTITPNLILMDLQMPDISGYRLFT
ncbi:response regulator [Aneurinibacillus sp. Ricciae_BoGa-3]|uniref:response regulator n=1 Tax=Aneurinibacillus sp. Ricciae_BoGa-3 TaxID=3022697 RepID=UPI003FA43A6F